MKEYNKQIDQIIKTFQFLKVNKKLRKAFISEFEKSPEDGYKVLKEFNENFEQEKEIKIERPFIHDLDANDIYTKIIQEAYVTAQLFDADIRLLNSIWSDDWEKTNYESAGRP